MLKRFFDWLLQPAPELDPAEEEHWTWLIW